LHIDNLLFWGETPLQKQTLDRNLAPMPDYPMAERFRKSAASGSGSLPDDAALQGTGAGSESDLGDLAALFAAHSGGSFSAEFSAELALEIVLNEIVEEACLATGATGAAIVLLRDGEMVCRASSGATAPELGARLDRGPGISGECIRTRRVQRCDDAQADPRADMEASRRLGVRSVIVLPLLRNAALAGVLEVFSTRTSAFGERDERTLEALAQRILKNLERAAEPFTLPPGPPPVPHPLIAEASAETSHRSGDPLLSDGVGRMASGRGIEVVTWTLGLTVLACAVLLGVLVIRRFAWRGETVRAHHVRTMSDAGPGAQDEPPQTGNIPGNLPGNLPNDAGVRLSSAPSKIAPASPAAQTPGSQKPGAQNSFPPAGGLTVYENGREVFRMPPSQGQAEPLESEPGSGVRPASSVEQQERTMELSPAAAEDSLVHRVEPEYPEEARQQQIQGPVVLDVHINQDGTVQEVKMVSGDSVLAQAAMDAVKQWRFKPHTVNGHPAEMQTRVTLNFRLPR
jgi:TonB family protein